MLVDIEKLPKEGLKISRNFDYASLDLVEEDAVFLKPVHAELTVRKIGEELWIKGRIATCLSFICSRCLMPYEFPVDSKFDLVYFPEELDVVKEELEDEDINKLFYYSRQINIREVILEQLNLTFPAKPLCSEDCEGMCPVCGKIRKDDRCGCIVKGYDPRLEKLKTFKR